MTNPADEWEDVFVEMKPIPEHGDHMTLKEWIDSVECGGFIDYDGWGDLATEKECSNIDIYPSKYKAGFVFPKWCTHIVKKS